MGVHGVGAPVSVAASRAGLGVRRQRRAGGLADAGVIRPRWATFGPAALSPPVAATFAHSRPAPRYIGHLGEGRCVEEGRRRDGKCFLGEKGAE